MTFRSPQPSLLVLAAILVVGSVAPLAAQNTFSKDETPLATISRMFLKAPARDSLVEAARSQVGARYKLGAKAPGKAFDCSGLVQWVMALFGSDLPRTAKAQAKQGIEIPKDPTQLLPGDLLYFGKGKAITHVGIYVGDGKYIHAATTHKGVVEAELPTGKLASTWWKGVRRLFEDGENADSVLLQPADSNGVKHKIVT